MSTEALEQAIEDEEGFRSEPYRDTKKLWTVGIGTCLERTLILPAQWKELLDKGMVKIILSREGARLLTRQKLEQIEIAMRGVFSDWQKIEEPRRNVVISMAYQMGAGFVYKFPNFTKAVNNRNWSEAKKHGLDSDWAREDSPARAKRLMDQLERGN